MELVDALITALTPGAVDAHLSDGPEPASSRRPQLLIMSRAWA